MLQEQRLHRWQGMRERVTLQTSSASYCHQSVSETHVRLLHPKVPEGRQLCITALAPCQLVS